MINPKKMSQMMKQAQQMQKKMSAVQETLEDLVVEGVAADGMVKVNDTGGGNIRYAFKFYGLKSDIKTLDGSKVYDMRGVSFTKKDSGKEGSGVIAQDVVKINPMAVDIKHNYLTVDYSKIDVDLEVLS